ncbi:MAG: MBL fold metallo-hydrolase [Pseudomonadales bacterium]
MKRRVPDPPPVLHSSTGTPLVATTGTVSVRLVNGVLGDPLAEIRVRGLRRRLLLDLGEAIGLSRRELHAVTDVFLTHAHFDHICGFLSLLRARIDGGSGACRIFGPPGIGGHIAGFVGGIHWDRIENDGPAFLVAEVGDCDIAWQRIQPGRASAGLAPEPTTNRTLLDGGRLGVSCIRLDHGIPVLAFAVSVPGRLKVREDRLQKSGYPPGPWLGDLKLLAASGSDAAMITMPDGTDQPVGTLRQRLLEALPATRVVYATDFADTPGNRECLIGFAAEADLLICESTFRRADRGKALETRHLTTDACGTIARAARVARLLPFHFSKRYVHDLNAVYREIEASAGETEVIRAERR